MVSPAGHRPPAPLSRLPAVHDAITESEAYSSASPIAAAGDLGSDDEWHLTMGSDSDVDEEPIDAHPLPADLDDDTLRKPLNDGGDVELVDDIAPVSPPSLPVSTSVAHVHADLHGDSVVQRSLPAHTRPTQPVLHTTPNTSPSATPVSTISAVIPAVTDEYDLDDSAHLSLLPGYGGVSSRTALGDNPASWGDRPRNSSAISGSPNDRTNTTQSSSAINGTSQIPAGAHSPRVVAVVRSSNLTSSSDGSLRSTAGESLSSLSKIRNASSYEVGSGVVEVKGPVRGSAAPSSSKSGSLKATGERRISGLRMSIRHRARLGASKLPTSRRHQGRASSAVEAAAAGEASASSSREAMVVAESTSGERGVHFAASSSHRGNHRRSLSTPSDGLRLREDVAKMQQLSRPTSMPEAAESQNRELARMEAGHVFFEKVSLQDGKRYGTRRVELDIPVARENSFLECIAEMLKGASVLKKKHFMHSSEAQIWLRPDMQAIEYRTAKKGAAPTTTTLILQKVTKLKGTDRDLYVDITDGKKALEFLFPTANLLDIWLSGLCCLVPKRTTVKKNNRHVQRRKEYHPLLDTWNDQPLPELKRLRELIILGTVGQGTTSRVKVTFSSTEHKFYALKSISKKTIRKHARNAPLLRGGLAGRDSELSMESLEEPKLMKSLEHKNIVQLYGVFEDEELEMFYYVTEYLPKGPVMKSDVMHAKMGLSEERARSAFVDVLYGLEYLHRNNIVHRDIKPDNLLCAGDGTVKINDFGAAIKYYDEGDPLEQRSNPCNINVGTPAFMAPELCISDHAPECPSRCFAADIWSLGATLFYLVYGRPPFLEQTVLKMYDVICTDDVVFPSTPAVSRHLQDLMRHILVKDPTRRPTIRMILRSPWLNQDKVVLERVARLRVIVGR